MCTIGSKSVAKTQNSGSSDNFGQYGSTGVELFAGMGLQVCLVWCGYVCTIVLKSRLKCKLTDRGGEASMFGSPTHAGKEL